VNCVPDPVTAVVQFHGPTLESVPTVAVDRSVDTVMYDVAAGAETVKVRE
jgi:hypothetical protein